MELRSGKIRDAIQRPAKPNNKSNAGPRAKARSTLLAGSKARTAQSVSKGANHFPLPDVTKIGQYKVKNRICGGPRKESKQPLAPLVDSTHLWKAKDFAGLWTTLNTVGYLFIRGLLERDTVLEAGRQVHNYLTLENGFDGKSGGIVALSDARPVPSDTDEAMPQAERPWQRAIRQDRQIQGLLRGKEVQELLDGLAREMNGSALILDPKMSWVRALGQNQATKVHADYFYLKSDTDLYTGAPVDDSLSCEKCGSPDDAITLLICEECDKAWHMGCLDPPLQQLPGKDTQYFCTACAKRPDVSVQQGSLCFLATSHTVLPNFDTTLHGEREVPASYSTTRAAKSLSWHVGAYEASDAVIFLDKLLHASTVNLPSDPRVSTDSRFALVPVDETTGEVRDTRGMHVLQSWSEFEPEA